MKDKLNKVTAKLSCIDGTKWYSVFFTVESTQHAKTNNGSDRKFGTLKGLIQNRERDLFVLIQGENVVEQGEDQHLKISIFDTKMNKPLSNVAVKGSLIGENEKVVDDFSGIIYDQGVLQYTSAIKHNAKLQ